MKKIILISALFAFHFSLFTLNCNAQWQETSLVWPTVDCFAIKGDTIFAGTENSGIYLSKNNGNTWVAIDTGLTDIEVWALTKKGDTVFAGTAGVCYYDSNGTKWTSVDSGLYYNINWGYYNVDAFALKGETIFAGTDGDGVYKSSNNGISWDSVNTGLTGYALNVDALAVSGNKIFAGTWFGDGVYLSSNDGGNWTYIGLHGLSIAALAVKGDTVFAGTNSDGVYLSSDTGHTWTWVSTGLTYNALTVYSLLIKGNNIFAGTAAGVYLSTNNGGNWVAINEGFPISPADSDLTVETFLSLAANDSYIFAGAAPYSDEPGQRAGVWRRPLSDFAGINEINNNAGNIEVYPNPATNNLQIQTALQIKSIEITDITGRLLYTTNAKTINCSSFAKGVYFIKATTEKGIVVKKFIKV